MRNVLGYIALVGSASLSEAALLYRRIGGSYTYELKDVTAPWTGKLGENDKYNFLVDRIGDYDPESDMVKCHGSCGSIMVLNRDGEVCKDPDNQQLADLCFGPCPALNPAAIYKPAIGYGKQCGFIPKEWTKEEARDAYLKKKASAATPTEAASSATPTQAAPQETSATEVPKADQSQTPAETETVTSTQVVQPAQSTTAALKPTQSTIAAPKPTETTDSSARSERSADSAAVNAC
ncbi:hypothetical protein XA68_11436 [Ophiocordyceps unilateralis]|uniref:Uncharacterized protein n=1 Tax=Ophiocordyceps unilateralis TaxID=268505 RepID=A0A2A9PPU6_OPHUN|nr:hypothetical protein XA68_11436 [Ophiocordyceps unilateralis]